MNSRIAELLDRVNKKAQQSVGALIARTRVHAFSGPQALQLLVEALPLGDNGRDYELRLYPAIAQEEVVPGAPMLQFAFVVFSPKGAFKQQRDAIERTRAAGTPNRAFVDMCTDLFPFNDDVAAVLAALHSDISQTWPHRTFKFLMMCTSAELDVVGVYADLGTLKQVALAAGRGSS